VLKSFQEITLESLKHLPSPFASHGGGFNTTDNHESCPTMGFMFKGFAVVTLAPLKPLQQIGDYTTPSALGTNGKETMESQDGPEVTRMVPVDLGADLLYHRAIQRSNTTPAPADTGNDYMEIDDVCLDNAVDCVRLDASLILEGGSMEKLSSAVSMTTPDTQAKQPRKRSNKPRPRNTTTVRKLAEAITFAINPKHPDPTL